MLIVVDPQSGVPVYRQLMDQIRLHIATGILNPGDDLPSTRALSTELGINPMTISKAYSYLERDGVVERRPGRTLVVRDQGEAELRRSRASQLQESLKDSVRIARQLQITNEDAIRIFEDMLEDGRAEAPEEGSSRDESD